MGLLQSAEMAMAAGEEEEVEKMRQEIERVRGNREKIKQQLQDMERQKRELGEGAEEQVCCILVMRFKLFPKVAALQSEARALEAKERETNERLEVLRQSNTMLSAKFNEQRDLVRQMMQV